MSQELKERAKTLGKLSITLPQDKTIVEKIPLQKIVIENVERVEIDTQKEIINILSSIDRVKLVNSKGKVGKDKNSAYGTDALRAFAKKLQPLVGGNNIATNVVKSVIVDAILLIYEKYM